MILLGDDVIEIGRLRASIDICLLLPRVGEMMIVIKMNEEIMIQMNDESVTEMIDETVVEMIEEIVTEMIEEIVAEMIEEIVTEMIEEIVIEMSEETAIGGKGIETTEDTGTAAEIMTELEITTKLETK